MIFFEKCVTIGSVLFSAHQNFSLLLQEKRTTLTRGKMQTQVDKGLFLHKQRR